MRYLKKSSLKGIVTAPASKSQTHRAIIAAGLAEGESLIRGVQLSDDILATIEGMRALGAEISALDPKKLTQSLTIKGIGHSLTTEGQKVTSVKEPYPVIQAKESGSTLRFLIPLVAIGSQPFRFVGEGKLGQRPLSAYQTIFQQQGLTFDLLKQEPLDLVVAGPLSSGSYELSGQLSSQFITGLLLALPLLKGDSKLHVLGEMSSSGYVAISLDVLEKFGVEIEEVDRQTYRIPGGQSYKAGELTIEGDFSQGAVYLCAGILGHQVQVKGLSVDSVQPDRKVMTFLKAFGGMNWVEEDGTISISANHRHGVVDLSGDQTPDIMPLLALVAALSEGESRLTNLGRLRLKESDRLKAVEEELTKIGADIRIEGDSWIIKGQSSFKGGVVVDSHHDHRIAMMLALASTYCDEPIYLQHSEVVRKSYPHFWEDWQKLGGSADLA